MTKLKSPVAGASNVSLFSSIRESRYVPSGVVISLLARSFSWLALMVLLWTFSDKKAAQNGRLRSKWWWFQAGSCFAFFANLGSSTHFLIPSAFLKCDTVFPKIAIIFRIVGYSVLACFTA